MSVESMAVALHHSRATGTAKLILLGIANHDGDGGAWPSVATLARYASCSERNVQKALIKLEELHEIRRHIQRGGNAETAEARRPNRYDFLLRCPADCDGSKNHRSRAQMPVGQLSTRVNPSSPGVAEGTPTGEPEFTLTVPYNHPSTTKKTPHVGERARGACGHDLIDDRHCAMGCRAAAVKGAA